MGVRGCFGARRPTPLHPPKMRSVAKRPVLADLAEFVVPVQAGISAAHCSVSASFPTAPYAGALSAPFPTAPLRRGAVRF